MNRNLIVDVGMSTGEDTEYYLAKGFDVVAIEADPACVAEVSSRLATFIGEGRLTIKPVAVADHRGVVEFLVSSREGWGSVGNDLAAARAAFGISARSMEVECDTFEAIMEGHPAPYFVKIDIEGADLTCIRGLGRLPQVPRFVSFECNPIDPDDTMEILDLLVSYGYRRFKLVNQALNPAIVNPRPPLEGGYVHKEFSLHSSGPFGEETPGEWVDADQVRQSFSSMAERQAVRARYTATGKVLGIPLARFHRQLEWAYNVGPVRWGRTRWAAWRGAEVGGWFDIHAGL